MARYLVTGGAGYVGSHVVLALHERGDDVVVVDNLRQGHRRAVPRGVELVVEDVGDRRRMDEIFASWRFNGVLHFAALSVVGESMRDPLRYISANLGNTVTVAEAAIAAGCRRFVLSSTAALFGCPDVLPIDEDAAIRPASPYGESKRMAESALEWAGVAHGLRSACLRYFNAAGADPAGRLGEDHDPETHLIPLAIDVALGLREELVVNGSDYPTPDGTCLRDYVHVSDLATAHLCALDALEQRGSCRYNVGNGAGHSVREVIAAVERVSGRPVRHRYGPRREGDPAALVASSQRLRAETGWSPRYGALDDIVRTAWNWRQQHPKGYGELSVTRARAS